ncbi:MAG TPA: transposase [Thermodesulfobacteriota bacterium]|nr:transposase [Thermodesulfobacteriota bacterium]
MPRVARIAPEENIYHVLTRGNNRQDIFKDESDYRKYIGIIRKYKERYGFSLYHYVLMRNHVHLVLETSSGGGSLAATMKGINLSYAQYYKAKYGHIGHFWQDRFKSILVSRDEYLLACGSYVELNPVRAGVVKDPKDYQWSSYGVYAFGKDDGVTDRHSIYERWSKDEANLRLRYREFVKGMLKEKAAMKGEMDRRVVYGSEDFVKQIEGGYKISAIIRGIGRPKKDGESGK